MGGCAGEQVLPSADKNYERQSLAGRWQDLPSADKNYERQSLAGRWQVLPSADKNVERQSLAGRWQVLPSADKNVERQSLARLHTTKTLIKMPGRGQAGRPRQNARGDNVAARWGGRRPSTTSSCLHSSKHRHSY